MTAGLETFAKVRALHDRTTSPGEKASAAARMKTLARKAGLTVEQAVSKLDTPPPAPRNPFEELFNTPEARAYKAEREAKRAVRRAEALAEYGSEDAVWERCERERALEDACRPLIVRKPIINGEMDTLQGWDGGPKLPPDVRIAVSTGYPLPETVGGLWEEYRYWEKRQGDQEAFWDHADFPLVIRARRHVLEHLLDTLPAAGMRDLRARLDWMQHVLDLGFSRDIHEDQACLDALRADIERMGQRLREQDEAAVQNGQPAPASARDHPVNPCAATAQFCAAPPVQSGHPRRLTRAERHAAIRTLIAEGLADREVARRLGISPTTVGTVRRAGQEVGQ